MVRPRRKVKIHNFNRNDFKKINISVARVAVPDLRGSGICMDPEFFLPGSGSGIIVPDLDNKKKNILFHNISKYIYRKKFPY